MLDTALDAWMLAIALRMACVPLKPLRIAAGALLGAAAAWSARRMQLSVWQSALLWLPCALAMAAAAAGRRVIRRPFRWTGLLLGAAGLLGGTIYALKGALGSLGAAYALSLIACAWIAGCTARARSAEADRRRLAARLRICFRGKETELEAILDSGNTLRDYLTHRCVIVLPQSARAALGLEEIPLRPIFADTAGGRQMMECFVPEVTELTVEAQKVRICAAAAFSPGLNADAPALVPAAFLHAQDGD